MTKLAGGWPCIRFSGTHETIIDGKASSDGHGSSAERSTRTAASESVCDDATHELKCLATSSALDNVRLRMNIFRHPNCNMAYIAARAIPPAPITSPVVLTGLIAFRGDKLRCKHTIILIQSVFSPHHAAIWPASLRRLACSESG